MPGGFDEHPEHINRKGRPKKEWTWSHIFEQEVEKLDDKSKKKIKYIMAEKMIKKVLQGDVQAFKEIANRMDGMPKENVNLGGDIIVKVIKRYDRDSSSLQIPTEELPVEPFESDGESKTGGSGVA